VLRGTDHVNRVPIHWVPVRSAWVVSVGLAGGCNLFFEATAAPDGSSDGSNVSGTLVAHRVATLPDGSPDPQRTPVANLAGAVRFADGSIKPVAVVDGAFAFERAAADQRYALVLGDLEVHSAAPRLAVPSRVVLGRDGVAPAKRSGDLRPR
jgi:hypothetical protein